MSDVSIMYNEFLFQSIQIKHKHYIDPHATLCIIERDLLPNIFIY